MSKPVTYMRLHTGAVLRPRPGAPSPRPHRRVAVIDPSPSSEDMERLAGLFGEAFDYTPATDMPAWVGEILTRFAAGESAAPAETYCLKDGEGDWWLSDKPETGFIFRPGVRSGPQRTLEYIEEIYGIDPGVVTFKPGQMVRSKSIEAWSYTIAENGYLAHHMGHLYVSSKVFTSEDYELVEES